ncbi:MAG: hypothetical protein Q4G05_01045 [Clostridia bacterium]|nr:hypothetical protein [Clostridia bacterium]
MKNENKNNSDKKKQEYKITDIFMENFEKTINVNDIIKNNFLIRLQNVK